MKKMISLLLAMGCVWSCLFLAGCGGGGNVGDSGGSSNGVIVKATVTVQADKVLYQPAMVGSEFVSLSDGAKAVSVDKKHVVKVFYNGGPFGWHIADPTKGINLAYDWSLNPTLIILGQPLSPTFGGNFSFLLDDGRELSQITDDSYLTIIKGAGMLAQRKSDGLLYSGSDCTIPTVTIQAKTIVNVNTLTGEVEITPSVAANNIINLVDSTPTMQILNAAGAVMAGFRIVWNDNGSWYPSSGKIAPLVLPKTVIAGAAKSLGLGAGMPYLVTPDNTSIPFNTSAATCTFMLNGVVANVNTDGTFHY